MSLEERSLCKCSGSCLCSTGLLIFLVHEHEGVTYRRCSFGFFLMWKQIWCSHYFTSNMFIKGDRRCSWDDRKHRWQVVLKCQHTVAHFLQREKINVISVMFAWYAVVLENNISISGLLRFSISGFRLKSCRLYWNIFPLVPMIWGLGEWTAVYSMSFHDAHHLLTI